MSAAGRILPGLFHGSPGHGRTAVPLPGSGRLSFVEAGREAGTGKSGVMMLFDVPVISPLFPGHELLYDLAEIDDGMVLMAFWTIVIEAPLFYICGYRKKKELLCFAGVNLVSNLLLNGFLAAVDDNYELAVLAGEIAVLLLEFCLCCYFVKEGRRKLFRTLALTNAVSCLAGLAYFFVFY